jgi:peptidoglycan hydrolase CwlO-like protein
MDKDDQDHWRVNYNAAIALVVGDLQKTKKEQEERIKKLEQENKDIRTLLESLQKKIEKLNLK